MSAKSLKGHRRSDWAIDVNEVKSQAWKATLGATSRVTVETPGYNGMSHKTSEV